MKHITLAFFILLFAAPSAFAQDARFNVPIKTIEGEVVNFSDVVTDGRKKVIVFWATYCGGCKIELKAMKAHEQKWSDELNADVIIVSIDGTRNQDDAKRIIQDKGWQGYEPYLDDGMKLYKSLKGTAIPLTLLTDGAGNILKRWEVYDDGLEVSIGMTLAKLAGE